MTDLARRIDEIRRRCEAATPGPWVDMSTRHEVGPIRSAETIAEICRDPELDDREADRDFIAHAREDVPWLLNILATADQERAERDAEAIELIKHVASHLDAPQPDAFGGHMAEDLRSDLLEAFALLEPKEVRDED